MNFCLNCRVPTANPKFCSISCSAKYNNPRKPSRKKPLPPCKKCAQPTKDRHSIFCSQQRQVDFKIEARLERWLSTGALKAQMIRVGDPIRAYILDDQNGHCALCPLTPIWNGKPLVFVLDHVDGNAEDNSRSNLRLVCPNCNSQLATFTSKNKNGRHRRRQRYAEGRSY